MADNDILVGYPQDLVRGRTLYRDYLDLSLAAQMIQTYNDGGAQTEDSAWTETDEREYNMPPDRILTVYPTTLLGSKLLHTDGEVTVNENGFVNADGSLDHVDRHSVKIAFNNWGAIRNFTAMSNRYDYMIIVTDGSTTHLYTIAKNGPPVTIQLPSAMTGTQSLTAPTMYVEVIFFDTDYGLTSNFVAGASGAYYFVWNAPVVLWFDVYNTIDTGILGGIGFLANLGLAALFNSVQNMLSDNAQLSLAASVAKVPIGVVISSLATALCLGAYYNWIDVDQFIRKGGIGKLVNAILNPIAVGSTVVGMAAGMLQNSWANVFSAAAGSVSAFITTQAMLVVLDDIAVEVSA
jgi:uncharacterized membrane protein YidH (DUF202 family)